MGEHALAFRVARLHPEAADHSADRSHPLAPSGGASPASTDAPKSRAGPAGFGTVFLGETLTLGVALVNASQGPVHSVGIRIEIQSDHGKAVLFDSMPTRGLASLAPGARHELTVKHDVRDLGAHTLLCSSAYCTPAAPAEPRFHPEAFRFAAQNPLVVRTKHRAVGGGAGGTVLLEAVIENRTQDAMVLDAVELAAAPGYAAAGVPWPPTAAAAAGAGHGPLGDGAAPPVLHPGGGAAGFVFRLERQWEESPGSSPRGGGAPGAAPADGTALGKLDIRWRGPRGDPARLQTQAIAGPPRPQRELRLELGPLPPAIRLAQPFEVDVAVVSAVDRRLGPLKLSYHPPVPSPATAAAGAGAAGAGAGEGIVMDGLQTVGVEVVGPRERATVRVRLLPRAPGRQYLQGLMLTDERDGREYFTIPPVEVYVEG